VRLAPSLLSMVGMDGGVAGGLVGLGASARWALGWGRVAARTQHHHVVLVKGVGGLATPGPWLVASGATGHSFPLFAEIWRTKPRRFR
jgi:hypothetical protein